MDNISFCAPKHYQSQLLLTCFSNNLPQVSKLSCFPLTKFPIKPPKFVPLKATCNDQETIRTYKKLPPSPWTDYFHSLSIDISEMDELRKEIDLLKLKAKNTIMSIDSRKKRILMIYLLVSLGLSYHFEEEITKTLKEGFEKKDEMLDGEEDLYTVSIIFWVFRKYGHYISSDVFKRFKGNNGKFKESLKRDIKGILGLYEAAHMRTTKDHILDEAFRFTSNQLELVAESGTCPPHLSTRIRNALSLSQHWNMETIAAVEYISFYEHEKGHDEMLLKFAKTSFKYVKLHYLQDLKVILKWYKEVDFESNLPPYFKDRIVENSFTIQAVFFDPQASRARIMYSQFYTLLGILDDTLDRYASIHEAETLSKNFQRWASDHTMDKQPDYLKFVFNFVVDTFKMFEKELRPEEKLYTVKATIEEYKILVKANCQHRRWVQAAHVPSFDEYMAVAEVMLTVYVSLAGAAMSLGEIATKEVFVWLKSRPKYVQSISMKGRLVNDIYGFEDDMNRGNVANAVNCYMKQYEVTKQEAIKELLKMVADADKTINEGLLTTTAVSRSVLKAALTIAQIIAVCYNGYEGFTNPEGKFKEYIVMVLLD